MTPISKYLLAAARVALTLLALGSTGCAGSGHSDANIPRQRAYPRIEVDEPTYMAAEEIPLKMEVNSAAEVATHREKGEIVWLDVAYPRTNAKIHYTFIPVDDTNRAEVAANRAERMALNAGDNPTELTSLEIPGGFHGQLLVTREATLTPVQSLAVGERWIVSGAARLDASNPDSVAPVVDAIAADMLRSLQSLGEK